MDLIIKDTKADFNEYFDICNASDETKEKFETKDFLVVPSKYQDKEYYFAQETIDFIKYCRLNDAEHTYDVLADGDISVRSLHSFDIWMPVIWVASNILLPFAINMVLVNCLVNTDYFLPCGVVIKKEDDKLVIENPGSIRTGKKQMLRGGISDPRNKTLMKMFNMIGIGERAGSGIPDIYQVWENEGWPMPVVEESYNPDRTRLSLEFSKKQAIKTSDKNKLRKTQEKEELIREYLRQNGLSKTSEIAEYIELSPARTRALLSDMTDVVVEGANKNRKYRLATED